MTQLEVDQLAENLRALGRQAQTIAEHLEAIRVAEKTKGLQNAALVDTSPGRVGDLAAWFNSLSPEQLQRCWVGSVLIAMQEHDWNYRELNLALCAVRDHPNGLVLDLTDTSQKAPKRPAPPTLNGQAAPAPETETGPEARPPRKKHLNREEMLAELDRRCPNIGDLCKVSAIATHGPGIKSLREAAVATGRYDAEPRTKESGGLAWFLIRKA